MPILAVIRLPRLINFIQYVVGTDSHNQLMKLISDLQCSRYNPVVHFLGATFISFRCRPTVFMRSSVQ